MRKLRTLLTSLCLVTAFTQSITAQTPLTVELIADGFNSPVLVLSPPDDDRLFVVDKPGQIWIIENGVVLPTPFLDIGPLVKAPSANSEQGLLSMAFDPDYANNGQFFVYFTGFDGPAGNGKLSRYTVSAGDPNVADSGSLCVVFANMFQPFTNHNGGHLAFGPDGMLYLSTGDGGSGNDPACRAQNPEEQLGKMLRIDVDPASCGFTLPPDNPFTGMGGLSARVWHNGLRNPWRFSFDRVTGDMYIGDVGQDAREEISFAPAGVGGLNFGWRVMEGNRCNGIGSCPVGTPPCNDPGFTPPIHEYNHPTFSVCSVTGGYNYRGCAIPDLQGTYFFTDVCAGKIWSFRYDGVNKTDFIDRTAELAPLVGSLNFIVSFGEDRYGEMYMVELNGEIWKIVPDAVVTGPDCDVNEQIDSCEIASGYVTDFDGNGQPDDCDSMAEDRNSAGAGESVIFTLRAGLAMAGDAYWIFGSGTGTTPGLDFPGGVNLPLNFDAYMLFTIKRPFAGVFTNYIGTFDGNGEANAAFSVPGILDPSLVGLTLNHAYLSAPALGGADFASNAVPFTLTM
ncbi:MAG: glucose/arabinose dehydrogenase [Planctomycetota bacterium]|jgi:glucose/arabinose dehydrogenase